MTSVAAFTHMEPELLPVLEELRPREPIFHVAAFGTTPTDFEQMMAPDYWEVGASGRRYSRPFILKTLEDNPPADAAEAGWRCFDFGLRALGVETYLLTYTLHQGDRVTRRATIWQRTSDGWHILYHQGTMVAGEDDTLPRAEEMSQSDKS